jgi:hypothetical protein
MAIGLITTHERIPQKRSLPIRFGVCVFALLITACTVEKLPKASRLTAEQYVNWTKTSSQQFIASTQPIQMRPFTATIVIVGLLKSFSRLNQ